MKVPDHSESARPESPPPATSFLSFQTGLGLAIAVWLVLSAAGWVWSGIQISHSPPATGSDATSLQARYRQNLIVHLGLTLLGLGAIGAGTLYLKRSRSDLQLSEEQYRLISSVAHDYVFSSTVEPDGRLMLQWAVGAFESITGYTVEAYKACGGWQARLHPDDVEKDALARETLNANQPMRSEVRTLHKSGRTVWVEVYAHPLWDDKHNCLRGIYGAVKDITLREQAVAESLATYETLKGFLDSVPAFASFVDQDERYQFVNRFYEDWFQKPRADFVGRKLAEVHRPSTMEKMKPHSQRALAGESVRYEHEMTGRDGNLYFFDVQYIPRFDTQGGVLGYFTLVFDITERTLLGRQLLRTQRLESVGRLASGIAHDLNNILSPILMAPGLLRDAVQTPAAHELLDVIEVSAGRGADILRQLLIFGRGEQETLTRLSVPPLLKEMHKIIKETFPRQIRIPLQLAANLPAVTGNPTQLHQVLMNLCLNARDAMPDGGILTLEARVEEVDAETATRHGSSAPGPHVVIRVADTGTGIPPSLQDKIFDPFFTTKPIGEGTGLGLSTVLGVVRSHHGFIQVDSHADTGTEFRVYLPAAEATDTDAAAVPDPPSQEGHGERILVVDDEEQIQRMTRRILERHGYQVDTCSNGQDALRLFTEDPTRFQLVFTDLMMPGLNGADLIHSLKRMAPDIKTVVATGGISPPEMAQVMDTDSSACICKPFSTHVLLETIQNILQA